MMILNSKKEEDKTKEFLELLVNFWINSGVIVLLSDNEPFIIKTNFFYQKFLLDLL